MSLTQDPIRFCVECGEGKLHFLDDAGNWNCGTCGRVNP